MIFSPRFTAVLDANVLYPAPVRDLLLNLADLEMYAPKWTELIQDEWVRNLLLKRSDLTKSRLMRTINLMNSAFPDAEVHHYEELIDQLDLPDANDNHVLAAAIQSKADAIITFNVKDFPEAIVAQFEIDIYTPDMFITLLHQRNPDLVIRAFENQLRSLKNPPVSRSKLIETLVTCHISSAKQLFK